MDTIDAGVIAGLQKSGVIAGLQKSGLIDACIAAIGVSLPTSISELKAMNKNPEFHRVIKEFEQKFDTPDPTHGYSNPNFKSESAAAPPGCSIECRLCAEQWCTPVYLLKEPYQRNYSDTEASKIIQEMKIATEDNLNYVRTLLDKHGDAITKSWPKKSVAQRALIVREAMPSMYPHKGFPINELNKKAGTGVSRIITTMEKYRQSLLLPYLDIETLSQKPTDLLALLYHRSGSLPSAWASFDNQQVAYAFRGSLISTSYNPHCVLMYGRHYGKLVSWEKKASHAQDMLGFPRAFLVFQAQRDLSNFLRKITDAIVCQTASTGLGCGRRQMDSLAVTGFATSSAWTHQYISQDTHCSPPPKFEMQNILETMKSRLRAAEDEVWLLQTDPAYLRQHLSRFEGAMLFNNTTPEEVREYKALLVMLPLKRLQNWLFLVRQAERMLAAATSVHGTIHPGSPLPKDYETAVSCFESAVKEEFSAQSKHISTLILCSKDFRDLCTGMQGNMFVRNHLGIDMQTKDPLYYHIMELERYDEAMSILPAYHFSMLDDIFASSKADARRVDQLLFDVVSDMAAMDQALNAIRLHRPRNRPLSEIIEEISQLGERGLKGELTNSDKKKLKDVKFLAMNAELDTFQVSQTLEHDVLGMTHILGYKKLHVPLESFLRLPRLSAKINRDALSNFDLSHAGLQGFWRRVRELQDDGAIGGFLELRDSARTNERYRGYYAQVDAMAREQIRIFSSWNAPEHLAGVAVERATLLAAIEAKGKSSSPLFDRVVLMCVQRS